MLAAKKIVDQSIKTVVLFCFYIVYPQGDVWDSSWMSESADFEQAKEIRHQNPDSSLLLLQQSHNAFIKKGDTLSAIWALLEMPYHYGQRVDYSKSYDGLWQALFLADDINNEQVKALIYSRLGRLHSFFKRESEAFDYLKTALKMNKKLIKEGSVEKTYLTHNYYLISATYRELNKPKMAKIYLDSCFLSYKDVAGQVALPYLKFESSYVLSQENKNYEALELLQDIEPWFVANRPSYLVLIYSYWADVYRNLLNLDKSEEYYLKALEISDTYNSHLDFSPLVHEKLADLYVNRGDFEKAFSSQKRAKELNFRFFDSRSLVNRPLLEIKDEFRMAKVRRERLIEQQRLDQLEQEDRISLLQRVIMLGTFVFLTIIGFIYMKHIQAKHKAEKQLIKKSKELEIKKASELLELKNKELAASALQLVEKDEFLKEIKARLKDAKVNSGNTEINKVLKSISHNNQTNWEEFKLRFTAVNGKFYKKVAKNYPNLSQADQKICALIKLNFSSKEMARLLGISVESVHTTRYRLRKKMGLDRSVNLEEFISNI